MWRRDPRYRHARRLAIGGLAARRSDGDYIAIRALLPGDVIADFLLEKYKAIRDVEIADIPRAAGGSEPFLGPFIDAYRLVFRAPHVPFGTAAGSAVREALLREGRSTAAADRLEARYMKARGNMAESERETSSTSRSTKPCRCAPGILRVWSKAAAVVSAVGIMPLTRRLLMRYLDGNGASIQLSYADLIGAGAEATLVEKEQIAVTTMLATGRDSDALDVTFATGDISTALHPESCSHFRDGRRTLSEIIGCGIWSNMA